jgi:hypothetical protein
MISARELCSFIADQPASRYDELLSCLELFKDHIFAGHVKDVAAVLQSLLDEQQQPPVSNTKTRQRKRHDDAQANTQQQHVLTAEQTAGSDNSDDGLGDVEPDNVPTTSASVASVVFNSAPKVKGRPANTKQRPFKVFGSRKRFQQVNGVREPLSSDASVGNDNANSESNVSDVKRPKQTESTEVVNSQHSAPPVNEVATTHNASGASIAMENLSVLNDLMNENSK